MTTQHYHFRGRPDVARIINEAPEGAIVITISGERGGALLARGQLKRRRPMPEIYRLTDSNHRTYGGTQWGPGVRHVIPDERRRPILCSDGVFHAYRTPLLAALLRRAHCPGYDTLWRCETPEIVADDGAQVGAYELTTLEIVELPRPTPEQCVRFAVLSALEVYDEPKFVAWAQRWLSGQDRSREMAWAAWVAARAAAAETEAAAWAAAEAAAAARAAREAAEAEAEAAEATAWTAGASRKIDFAAIAERAMEGDC